MRSCTRNGWVVALAAGMLLSCGGGGGSSTPPPAGDAEPGGIWLGTWTGPSGGEQAALAFSTDVDSATGEARFNFILPEIGIHVAATGQVDGTRISGSGTAYTTEPGDTFPGGSTTSALSFTGTLQERSTLDGDWSIAAGDSGSFSLAYDAQHTRGAELSRLDGLWALFDLDGNPAGFFDISNGMIFRQTPVCTSMGTITIPDPQYNIYDWAATVTSNTPGSCPIEGNYVGLGALTDSVDDSPAPLNDEFDVLVTSPTRAIPLLLIREP